MIFLCQENWREQPSAKGNFVIWKWINHICMDFGKFWIKVMMRYNPSWLQSNFLKLLHFETIFRTNMKSKVQERPQTFQIFKKTVVMNYNCFIIILIPYPPKSLKLWGWNIANKMLTKKWSFFRPVIFLDLFF